MKVWRIATESKSYLSTDLSGMAALHSPGRWNPKGIAIIYSASTPSLAMLETTAHVDSNNLPLQKFLIEIEIPDEEWERRIVLSGASLPIDWDTIPHGHGTVECGRNWILQGKSLVLCVPSAITPEDTVVLLNPLHPSAKLLAAVKLRPIDYKTVLR